MVSVWMLCGMLGLLPGKNIYAEGSINSNEAAVLAALDGKFTYDGNEYVVDPSYKEALRAYFSKDGVDLSASQKSRCINEIAGNVGQAAAEGYLVKVGTASETKKNQKEEKKKTSSKKQRKKTKDTKKKTKKNTDKKNTESPKPLSKKEKARLEEKWKDQIAAIEEDAKQIREGTAKPTAEPSQIAATEKTIEDTKSNHADKSQKAENSQTRITVALGLLAMAGVFFMAFRIWRRHPRLQEDCYTDLHTHILPGVDDGSKNMEETLAMLRKAKEQGIRTIIATPHYKVGQQKKTAKELQQIQNMVQQTAKQEGITMEILLGNELYYNSEICERLDKGEALTLAGSRYVLVEFSVSCEYGEMYHGLRKLIQNGYIPILAHIERYACLHKDRKKEKIKELIRLGVYMQMNTDSLKRYANRKLVKEGYIHFFGSDCHNMGNRKPNMQDGIKELGRSVDRKQLEKIVLEHPKKVREDKFLR